MNKQPLIKGPKANGNWKSDNLKIEINGRSKILMPQHKIVHRYPSVDVC